MSTLYAKFRHILPWSCRGSCISVRFLRLLSNLVVRVVVSAEKKTRLIKLTFCLLIVSKKVVIFQQEITCFQSLKRVNRSTKRADYTKIDYESKNPSFKQTTMFVFEKEKACTTSNWQTLTLCALWILLQVLFKSNRQNFHKFLTHQLKSV